MNGRQLLLANDDVRLLITAPAGTGLAETNSSGLYRNATGDELVYVESGSAVLESVYGRLEVGPGDYVVCLGAGNIAQWAYELPGQLKAMG